jgi:hypothetical protein
MRYVHFLIVALVMGFAIGAAAPRSSASPRSSVESDYSNVNTCIKSCGGDDDCVKCCKCVASGKPPSSCCF